MIASAAMVLWSVMAVAAPQRPTPMFRVERDGEVATVSANEPQVACDRALRELATAMGWGLRFQLEHVAPAHGERLAAQLAGEFFDLAIEAMDPEDAARLIAIIGGAEVMLREVPGSAGERHELLVSQAADAATAVGAARLRERSLHWYRRFLEHSPRAADGRDAENLRARVEFADTLRARGEARDLADAVSLLEDTMALAPFDPVVPLVLLRMVQCYRAMGDGWQGEAEQRARRLVARYSGSVEAAQATVLLGRILFERGEFEACVHEMENALHRVATTPELTEVELLVATARLALDDAAGCRAALQQLQQRSAAMSPDQRQQFDYLSGSSSVELGDFEVAVAPLERFIARAAVDDVHRAIAFVQLGRAWFELEHYLHARLAAGAARRSRSGLDGVWTRRVNELWTRARLVTGDEDRAMLDLRVELRRHPEVNGELALVLGQELIERGAFGQAVSVLETFVRRRDELGDRCRVLQVVALFEQARANSALSSFVERARPVAARIVDPARQAEACEYFARAFEATGDLIRAASARQGVIR